MTGSGSAQRAPFISMDAFCRHLDFVQRSGMDEARLIGGEPTLHPHFAELIRLARLRTMRIVVFSNGLMPEPALACLENLPPEQCSVLVNMNASRAADGPTHRERARRQAALKRLGSRALPGFTIFRTDFRLEPVVAAIEEADCQRAIRIGLAHAGESAANRYLHPKQYPVVGHRLALAARQAAQHGVRLEFDCGFVRCMFSPEDLETLQRAGAEVVFRCSPILDVDITGSVMHCFPLTSVAMPAVGPDDTAQALRDRLSAQTQPYRLAGIYRECSTCPFKQQGVCTGGCLAATLRRFRYQPFAVQVSGTLDPGGR